MKQTVIKTLEEDINLTGSVESVVNRLSSYSVKYPGYTLTLDIGGGWDSQWYNLVGQRPETDEEYQTRVGKEAEEIRIKEEKKAKRLAYQQSKAANRKAELEKELARLKGL